MGWLLAACHSPPAYTAVHAGPKHPWDGSHLSRLAGQLELQVLMGSAVGPSTCQGSGRPFFKGQSLSADSICS